jgi:hypothetical protein
MSGPELTYGPEMELSGLTGSRPRSMSGPELTYGPEMELSGLDRLRDTATAPAEATKVSSLQKFAQFGDLSMLKAAAQHRALTQFGLSFMSPVTSFQFRS